MAVLAVLMGERPVGAASPYLLRFSAHAMSNYVTSLCVCYWMLSMLSVFFPGNFIVSCLVPCVLVTSLWCEKLVQCILRKKGFILASVSRRDIDYHGPGGKEAGVRPGSQEVEREEEPEVGAGLKNKNLKLCYPVIYFLQQYSVWYGFCNHPKQCHRW